ncbi:MAG: hypothetical protein H0T45_02555 [Pyrinomonadaceae bacterium]|nr:hypothetical protein [Pyrinomonadaceae bacterium]
MATKKPRQDRSDITVKNIEKKHGLPAGTIRNADGRDTRGDKKLETMRKAAKTRRQQMKEIVSGYTFDHYVGAVYHFQHLPLSKAEQLALVGDAPFIVETINWTLADSGEAYHNTYFAANLDDALGLAVRLRLTLEEVAEEVVAIRPATKVEAAELNEATQYYLKLMPPAIDKLHNKKGTKRA